MAKFKADKCYKMVDEEGNILVTFVASGYERRIAEMAVEESKKMTGGIMVETKEKKAKRSLEQNAMLWALLTKLAIVTAGNKSTETINGLYCDMLKETNADSTYIAAPGTTEDDLAKVFRAVRKVGERTVRDKDNQYRQLTLFQCFPGSSKFDVKQMTELIEVTLDKCAEFGIMDPETERIRQDYK